jgi:hypothetical protein
MTDLIAVPEGLSTAGAIVFWRLMGGIDAFALEARWKDLGLSEKNLPKMPRLETALRRAVKDQGQQHLLVRTLSRGKWALVREREAFGTLEYDQECRMSLDASGEVISEPAESSWAAPVQLAFAQEKRSLSTNDISTWLVRRVEGLNAVSMRDTGGIYFLPQAAVATWHKIVDCVRGASNHKLFEIPALKSDEAVDAILDALTREAEQMSKRMEEKLTGVDDLGERAFTTQARLAKEMFAKIVSYEDLLGRKLDTLRNQMGELQVSLAAAALAAVSKEAA